MHPRYNISPNQMIPVIRESGRQIDFLKWGLQPFGAAQDSQAKGYINARAETLFDKPTFKRLISHQRCIIPATGYYEWLTLENKKQPYHIRLNTDNEVPPLFGIAGIWARWQNPKGLDQDTCAIITVKAHPNLVTIADRMPLIVSKEHYKLWLKNNSTQTQVQALLDMLSHTSLDYKAYPVSVRVNSPHFDNPLCIHPL